MKLGSEVGAAAAPNNGNHDPRLLYILVLGSSRAHYSTPLMDARDDVIAADVRRNGGTAKWILQSAFVIFL